MSDEIERQLRALQAEMPEPRLELNEHQKDALIQRVGGPRTAQNILKAQKDYARDRIPFLFNSLDTQAVLDILHNDMEAALARALQAAAKKPKSRSRS